MVKRPQEGDVTNISHSLYIGILGLGTDQESRDGLTLYK